MRTRFVVLAFGAILAACGAPNAAGSPSVPPASQSESVATQGPSSNLLSDSFDIGGGRSLYLLCRGQGSPTVLLEGGDTDGIRGWEGVMPSVAEVTRTCAYDRAGIGRSSPATGCRRLPELIGDLEALIEAAEIAGPYVLVAASGGGFIASTFARLHSDEIAGMVFVDVPRAYQDPPPELIEDLRCDNPRNIERRDYLHVENEAWDNRAEIGDIPITIMSVQYTPDIVEEDPGAAFNVETQQGWLVMSPRAEQQVVTHTGHGIHYEDPDLVVQEIIEVVEAARADL